MAALGSTCPAFPSLLSSLPRPGRSRDKQHQFRIAAEHRGGSGSSSSAGSSSSSGGRRGRNSRKAKVPGLFEVQDISPPKRSLGIHALPPSTHNGDEITVEGSSYVVQSVVMQFKLVKGRYERDHARLEVQHTGRFLYNRYLEEMYNVDSSHLSSEGKDR